MKHYTLLYIALCGCMLLTACSEIDDLVSDGSDVAADNIIHIGGIDTDELVATAAVTRADVDEETVLKTDAENISWLRAPLFAGLDITYGLSANREGTSRVAILKLLADPSGENGIKYSIDGDKKYAEYSFLYRRDSDGEPTTDPAIWYGNGAHFFEGLYIPEKIQYNYTGSETPSAVYGPGGSAENLHNDQHNDTESGDDIGNYTLLSHYLGMPSNYTINATVARIKLPFRHRLARVLAYILIDPEMGEGVKINGYSLTDGKDDPTSTAIKFCNVKVLAGVKDSYNETTKHHTYNPQWIEVRKATPHFVDERGSYNDRTNEVEDADNFIAFYNTEEKTYTYPDDNLWDVYKGYTYNAETGLTDDGKFQKIVFGKVPVYDLIVQPTYTSLANVMYDEEGVSDATTKQNLYAATNQIDFELTLNNGLQYAKRFTFDLDANYQTVVYLHISRERVDYNSSGSELWVETRRDDGYYGVNNQNGNTLSYAGSGWQRAYANADPHFDDIITDGHYYKYDSEDRYAQYVTDALWIEMLRQACAGGKHHGDYFILRNDISIPAAAFPEGFVFTGHLDGQDHTITLTDASYTPAYDAYEDYDDASLTKYVKSGDDYIEFTPSATTYYQKVSEDNYSEIADINAYAGTYAYTRAVGSYTYTIVPVGSEYSGGPYYNSSHDEIADIDTHLATFNNNVYTRSQNADSYSVVSSPTENPKSQGWYELNDGVYTLTEDTEVAAEKTYYTKDEVSYTYTPVADAKTLSPSGTYYKKEDENFVKIDNINTYIGVYTREPNYNYTEIHFYKFVHHESVIGGSTGTPENAYMFSGLNGNYSTAQESDESAIWEANVHKEERNSTTYWVPYKGTNDGWRAEVINVNVNGGQLFKTGVTYPPTDGATVTGYVHNCWQGSTYSDGKWTGGTKVTEYTPAIPEY